MTKDTTETQEKAPAEPAIVQPVVKPLNSIGQQVKTAYEQAFVAIKGINADKLDVSCSATSENNLLLTVSGKSTAVDLFLDELRAKSIDEVIVVPDGIHIPSTTVKHDEKDQSSGNKKIFIDHYVTTY